MNIQNEKDYATACERYEAIKTHPELRKEKVDLAKAINVYEKELGPQTVLEEANELIYGDRAAAYGPVTTSFERIGKFWETILGVPVTAEQVGLCMIALKMSRQISKSGRDNIVDIAGYAGCIAKMDEEKAAKH